MHVIHQCGSQREKECSIMYEIKVLCILVSSMVSMISLRHLNVNMAIYSESLLRQRCELRSRIVSSIDMSPCRCKHESSDTTEHLRLKKWQPLMNRINNALIPKLIDRNRCRRRESVTPTRTLNTRMSVCAVQYLILRFGLLR